MGCTHSQVVETKHELGALAQEVSQIAAAIGDAIPAASGVANQVSEIASAAGDALSNSRSASASAPSSSSSPKAIRLAPGVHEALVKANDAMLEKHVETCLPVMRELVTAHKHDPIDSHNWPYYVAEAITAVRSNRTLKTLDPQRKRAIVKACICREIDETLPQENSHPDDYLVLQASVVNGIDAVFDTQLNFSQLNDPIKKVAKQVSYSGCSKPHVSEKSNRALKDPLRSRERGGDGSAATITHEGNRIIAGLITERAGLQKDPFKKEIENLRIVEGRLTNEKRQLESMLMTKDRELETRLEAKDREKQLLVAEALSRAEEARKKYEHDLEETKRAARDAAQVTYGRSIVPVALGSPATSTTSSSATPTPTQVTAPVRQVAAMTSPRRSPAVSPVRNLGASKN